MALRLFAGKRMVHKMYADGSGEISKALKTLSIMPQGRQPGVPHTNAVVERATGDVLAGTRGLRTIGCWVGVLLLGVCNQMLLLTGQREPY